MNSIHCIGVDEAGDIVVADAVYIYMYDDTCIELLIVLSLSLPLFLCLSVSLSLSLSLFPLSYLSALLLSLPHTLLQGESIVRI